MVDKFETHCGKQGCICDHQVSCHKGWRDIDDGPTAPCQVCRADTHRRWLDSLDARSKGLPLPVIAKIWTGTYAR